MDMPKMTERVDKLNSLVNAHLNEADRAVATPIMAASSEETAQQTSAVAARGSVHEELVKQLDVPSAVMEETSADVCSKASQETRHIVNSNVALSVTKQLRDMLEGVPAPVKPDSTSNTATRAFLYVVLHGEAITAPNMCASTEQTRAKHICVWRP